VRRACGVAGLHDALGWELKAPVLAPVLVILAFLLALAGALLENSARAVDIARRAQIVHASDAALSDGVADFTRGLAAYVARHGTEGPWPAAAATSPPQPLCDATMAGANGSRSDAVCGLTYRVSGTITDASGAATNAAPDAAANLQGSIIDEQRISAIVSVQLSGPAGAAATRMRFLTYRVFATAPYAIVSGSRDITTVDGSAAAAQGDSGGIAGGAGADDTRIHIRLTCRTITPNVVPFGNDQQAPGNDALPWGNAAQSAYETPCSTPDAPVDAFRDERWHNGDANPTGWTQ
jgi:hypothetical protein